MYNFIMAEDSELRDVICDFRHVPMKFEKYYKISLSIPYFWKDYNEGEKK